MDTAILVLYIIIGVVIQILLLMWIISSATETKKKLFQADVTNRLLILIAKRLNANQNEINEAISG